MSRCGVMALLERRLDGGLGDSRGLRIGPSGSGQQCRSPGAGLMLGLTTFGHRLVPSPRLREEVVPKAPVDVRRSAEPIDGFRLQAAGTRQPCRQTDQRRDADALPGAVPAPNAMIHLDLPPQIEHLFDWLLA